MGVAATNAGRVVGRYVVFDEIASGGMATVHLGRLVGAVGFSRTVAVKRLHSHLARDEEFVTMFLDEARIAARIRHPNVVGVLDVVHEGNELLLVMDYVQGETLSRLARAARPGVIPPRIAVTVITGVLHGLHAAHEATTENGEPLSIVHRDVSPQNVMVGTDGVARVLDFGVAKAAHRAQHTQDGMLKGKIAYMAPEQLLSDFVDRRADVYAAAVVLWEALTGERLFEGDNQGRVVRKILDEPIPPPSARAPGLPKALDEAVMRGLERDLGKRWQTAREFAAALERAMPAAPATEIGEWVEAIGGTSLGDRAKRVKEIESRSDISATAAKQSGAMPAAMNVRDSAPTALDLDHVTQPDEFAPMGESQDVKFSEPPPPTPRGSDPGPASGERPAQTPRQLKTMPLAITPQPMRPIKTVAIVPSPGHAFPLQQVPAPPAPTSSQPSMQQSRDSSPEAIDDLLAAVPSIPPKRSRAGRIVVVVMVLLVLAAAGATWWLRLHGKL